MKLLNFVIILFLSGCSTYNSKFICKEASGLPCEMLNLIDKKITQNQVKNMSKKCCK